MNFLASLIISVLVTFGGIYYQAHHPVVWDKPSITSSITFGTTGYPAALDTTTTLPNPGATDSVATVSHSALHTNENGGIIALETKIGTGASTPISNSLLNGTSAGVSSWSATPTITGFLALGSSTLQNFTFINATGTSATTTNFFATTASSTNLFSNAATIGTLNSTVSNITTLSVNSCSGCSSGAFTVVSTTTVQNLSTSTLESIPLGKNLHVTFEVASTSDTNAPIIWFNDKFAGWKDIYLWNGEFDAANPTANNTSYINMGSSNACAKGCKLFIDLVMSNGTSTPKMGRANYYYASSSPDGLTTTVGSQGTVSFLYTSTTRAVQSISIGHLGNPPLTGAGANYIGVNSTTTAYALNP